jgi:hypothetical protein
MDTQKVKFMELLDMYSLQTLKHSTAANTETVNSRNAQTCVGYDRISSQGACVELQSGKF